MLDFCKNMYTSIRGINYGNCENQKNGENQYKNDRESNKKCKNQKINTSTLI